MTTIASESQEMTRSFSRQMKTRQKRNPLHIHIGENERVNKTSIDQIAKMDRYLTAVFFETGAMATLTKSQNLTNCG